MMMSMTFTELWCFVSKRLAGFGISKHEQPYVLSPSGVRERASGMRELLLMGCSRMAQLLKSSRALRQANVSIIIKPSDDFMTFLEPT
jgi:hypothetical protein